MAGTASARANAVICDPSKGTVQQYSISAKSFAGIQPNPTSGTFNMSVVQNNGQTIMSWYRGFDNGDAHDAQISQAAATQVIYAVTTTNTFGPALPPIMSCVAISFASMPDYDHNVVLATGLQLNWVLQGTTFHFQAVLNKLAWCVGP